MRPRHVVSGVVILLALLSPRIGLAEDAVEASVDSLQRVLAKQSVARVHGEWGSAQLVRPREAAGWIRYESVVVDSTRRAPLVLPQPLAMDAVTRIEVRSGRSLRGALVGAGIMTLFTILVDSQFGSSSSADGSASTVHETGSPAIGIVLGAGVGAVLGIGWKGWRTIYER
ncbi:MAG: hypothetical protein U0704_15970 [Candidatus Eisenbacteria bacterium]